MSELRVREFPHLVPASGFACIHAHAAAFESCIDGQYRASYDACAIRYTIDEARAGHPNEFVRTELLLQDFFAEAPPQD